MDLEEIIEKLRQFKSAVDEWGKTDSPESRQELRTDINQNIKWARQQVIESGCFQVFTLGPPAAMGGLILKDVDAFQMIFERPYMMRMDSPVIDMVDQTIGVLLNPADEPTKKAAKSSIDVKVVENYAFIAMPMDPEDPELEDVLDAIKEATSRCGVQAERIDEPETTERITDRILESIQKAEYVIVDLTHSKSNVYFEAGYAHGLGKIPIYIAKLETKLEFDLKDYPVIFFNNMKQLKDSLEKRIRGLAGQKQI